MNIDTSTAPWAYDELQLLGAELGDTVKMSNEQNQIQIGLIVYLTKNAIFTLTEKDEIIKFGRNSLTSIDGKWDINDLSENEMKISKEKWIELKNRINCLKNIKKRNQHET